MSIIGVYKNLPGVVSDKRVVHFPERRCIIGFQLDDVLQNIAVDILLTSSFSGHGRALPADIGTRNIAISGPLTLISNKGESLELGDRVRVSFEVDGCLRVDKLEVDRLKRKHDWGKDC